MNRIKELRKAKGITQVQLCKKLGIFQSSLSLWESGKFEPDLKSVFKLCEILECTADYLLGRTDENGYILSHEERKIDNLYMHLAQEAQDMQLPEEDIEMILDFARRIKEKNDKFKNNKI